MMCRRGYRGAGKSIAILGLLLVLWQAQGLAYLEDVDAQGRSTYITEGCLRASHRALAQPPHARLDLPYHSGLEKDTATLPNELVELVFDLLPTSQHLPAGHRIRIAVTCADKDSHQTPQRHPAPAITVFRDARHPSYVILPVVG